MAYFQCSVSILALLLILVHSFYSWERNGKENHLHFSFEKFINSSQPVVIASAVEQAIKSCGGDLDSLCEEIIQIVLKNSLGRFILILSMFIHML